MFVFWLHTSLKGFLYSILFLTPSHPIILVFDCHFTKLKININFPFLLIIFHLKSFSTTFFLHSKSTSRYSCVYEMRFMDSCSFYWPKIDRLDRVCLLLFWIVWNWSGIWGCEDVRIRKNYWVRTLRMMWKIFVFGLLENYMVSIGIY